MPGSTLQRMANVNGQITPLDEAKISVLDRGFLYGDSVYEVFRTYSGVPLFCHEHFDRMDNSARLIHMTISQSRDEMLDEMRRTATAAEVPPGQDIYVRWHVTRGTGALDLVPARDLHSSFVIILKEVPSWKPEFYSRGTTLAVTRVRRNPVEALSPDIKSGNYLNNILGVAEAVDLGADDCLMLNPAGIVTEASNSNVFFVIDGELVTPNAESGILRGITKAAIQRLSAEQGFTVHEARHPASDLAARNRMLRHQRHARSDAGRQPALGRRHVRTTSRPAAAPSRAASPKAYKQYVDALRPQLIRNYGF